MSDSQLAVRPKASQQLATLIGMDPTAMLETIKAQCFKTNPANVSDAQLAAFISIASEMKVNPLLPGMLYAYPIQGGGIVPIMGPDGIYKKLAENPDIDSWETEVFPQDTALPPTHATTKIWRKGRERPLSYTALMSEWKVGSNPNWNTRPRHMLALRSLKHCARQIIHGLPGDEDDRIISGEINVTPHEATTEPQQNTRPKPPPREKKGAAAVESAAIDVPATEVKETEKKVEPTKPVEQSKPEPKAEPKIEKPVEKVEEQPKNQTPRQSLQDKERISTVCIPQEVFALNIRKSGVDTPSVKAKISGGFIGDVLHFGGSTRNITGDGFTAIKEWKVGVPVKLDLIGMMNTKSGNLITIVEKISPVEAEPETAPEVE
jgi:hypothetical protein